jgi:hypothetical protein
MSDRTEPKNFFERYSLAIGLVITIAAIALPLGLTAKVDDFQLRFELMALSAGIVAVIAALLRVIAHGGSFILDGMGKALSFSAAVLAVVAAALLLLIPAG